MIQILVDSTSAISDHLLKKYGNIHVVPLSISINGKYEHENKTTIEKVIEYSEATHKSVPTSQPSTGEFLEMIHAVPAGDGIIMICITSGVSGTYNGAVLAARQSGRKNIAVINSRTTAIGMVQLVEDAEDFISRGLPFKEVAERVKSAALHMRTTFTVSTLNYLRRGGRIGRASSLIGGILRIKPVIYLNDNNEVDVLGKVRTNSKAQDCMISYLHDHSPCKRIGIVHIENPEGAEVLRQRVQKEYPDIPVTVSTGTPVLASYLGPGLTGIIFESAEE